jgi:hypothetical protein
VDRSPRELTDILSGTYVIGVEVGHHDPSYRRIEPAEDLGPPLGSIGKSQPRIDERPTFLRRRKQIAMDVIDPERQREGDSADSTVKFKHQHRMIVALWRS